MEDAHAKTVWNKAYAPTDADALMQTKVLFGTGALIGEKPCFDSNPVGFATKPVRDCIHHF